MSLYKKLREKDIHIEAVKVSNIQYFKEFIYLGSEVGSFQKDYFFYHDSLSALKIYGCANLHKEMSKIEVGEKVVVQYLGKKPTQEGRFTHQVLVLRKKEKDNDLIQKLKEDLWS